MGFFLIEKWEKKIWKLKRQKMQKKTKIEQISKNWEKKNSWANLKKFNKNYIKWAILKNLVKKKFKIEQFKKKISKIEITSLEMKLNWGIFIFYWDNFEIKMSFFYG